MAQAQVVPQTAAQQDQLSVGVWTRHTQGFGTNLMKLPIAALLGALVAKHRAGVPQAFGAVIQKIVLKDGAHNSGCVFRPQG